MSAVISDRASGEKTLVRARYVVAADAGRTVGPIVGSRMQGTNILKEMITVYFRADLSAYFDDDQLSTPATIQAVISDAAGGGSQVKVSSLDELWRGDVQDPSVRHADRRSDAGSDDPGPR